MFSELLKNNYRIHRDNKRRLVFFFSDLGCILWGEEMKNGGEL